MSSTDNKSLQQINELISDIDKTKIIYDRIIKYFTPRITTKDDVVVYIKLFTVEPMIPHYLTNIPELNDSDINEFNIRRLVNIYLTKLLNSDLISDDDLNNPQKKDALYYDEN